MAEMNPSQFYLRVFAKNPLPEDYEKDESGCWILKPGFASGVEQPSSTSSSAHPEKHRSPFQGFDLEEQARSDQDARSVSSNTVEAEDQTLGAGDPKSPSQSMSGSGYLSIPISRSTTPMSQSRDTAALLVELGSCHSEKEGTQPNPLTQLHNEYQHRFVSFRKRQAGERLKAALSEKFKSASDEDSFHLAAFSHDELCSSNGGERMNEEQTAIRMEIDKYQPAQVFEL